MIFALVSFIAISSLKVNVKPDKIELSPGKTIKIKVEVYDDGKRVDPQWVRYRVVPKFLGRVRNGSLTAFREGTGVVKAIAKYKDKVGVGFAFLTVEERKDLLNVKIEPARIRLQPGEEERLFLFATFNNEPIEAEKIHWKVIPSWLGQVDREGVFHAGERIGAGKVVAVVEYKNNSKVATVPVLIGRPREFPLDVKITPSFAVVPVGDRIEFESDVMNVKFGVEDSVKFSWWLDPPDLGSIEDGEFLGMKPGRGTVWALASYGDQVGLGRAMVVVREELRGGFDISPSDLVLDPGEKREILFRPPRRRPPLLDFDFIPEDFGSVFFNPEERSLVIEAGESPGVGFIEVRGDERVVHRLPVLIGKRRLEIEPREVTVRPGERIHFKVKSKELSSGVYRWKVIPEIGGMIDENGTFVASGSVKRVYVLCEIDKKYGGGGAVSIVNVMRGPEFLKKRLRGMKGRRWR